MDPFHERRERQQSGMFPQAGVIRLYFPESNDLEADRDTRASAHAHAEFAGDLHARAGCHQVQHDRTHRQTKSLMDPRTIMVDAHCHLPIDL